MLRMLVFGLLMLPSLLVAQATQPPFKAEGAFLALSVADVAASARWYQEKLGLKTVLTPPKAGEAQAIILEGGGLLVEHLNS